MSDDFFKGVEQPSKPPSTPSGKHPFCRRHSSHFCPCVRPDLYRKGDVRGDPEHWDKVQQEAREKKEARRDG